MSLGIFSVVPPTEPCALRSNQLLKVSTRYFSWGKCGRCVWLTTYHTCSAQTSRKSRALTYPEPLGPPRPVAADLIFYFSWRQLYGFFLILNNAWSDGYLNRRPKILTVVNCWWCCCVASCSIYIDWILQRIFLNSKFLKIKISISISPWINIFIT